MAVTPKANLNGGSSLFFSRGGGGGRFSNHHHRRALFFSTPSTLLVAVVVATSFFALFALRATGNARTFRVRIRLGKGGDGNAKTESGSALLKEKAHEVLDEVKHSFDHVFHTTFGDDDDDDDDGDGGERERVVAHDLPQSTVDAHLVEMTEEEEKKSSGDSSSGGSSDSGSGSSETTTSSSEQSTSDAVAAATTTTTTAGNKPHLARGWLVSKLPFDVDQPGSERSALEANFNGSVPLLTHRGLFKYDPTPRVDGMNYYRRVYAVTQVGMAQDLPNWKSVGEAEMEATANSMRRRRSLLRHRNSGGSEGAADADGEALAAEAETVIDEGDDVGLGSGGDSGGGGDGNDDGQEQQQQHVKIEVAGAGVEEALRSKPPGTRGLTFRITKHLYDALPPRDPSWRYKTCAVVGNGGSLLTTRHGKDIDAHDAVLRMNNAPVGGRFTDYVGSKTTFNMINFHWAREITQRTPVVETDAFLVMYESVLHTLRNQLYPKLLRMQAQGQLPVVPVLTSPDFTVKGYGIWLQLKDVLEQRRAAERRQKNEKLIKEGKAVEQLKHPGAYKRKPMSGFFAMLFMLNLCDSVDMYGFSNWRPSRSKIPYHYFDKVKGTTAVHSFDLSMEVFMEIAKAHDVNMIDSEGKSTKLK
jgi:hypothetical protein